VQEKRWKKARLDTAHEERVTQTKAGHMFAFIKTAKSWLETVSLNDFIAFSA
jgi:hypothetical protein